MSGTCCVSVPQRAGAFPEDPGLAFFGSQRKKRESVCTVVLYVLDVLYVLSVSYCIFCIVPYRLYCVFFIHKIH